MSDIVGMYEKICPICKKRFFTTTSEWGYKTSEHGYYCSWKCLREFEKTKAEKRTRKYNKLYFE